MITQYTLHTIHQHNSTLDEEDSHFFLQKYNLEKRFNYIYKYPKISMDTIYTLSSSFALFYAKINRERDGYSIPSNYPLNIFRYIMTEDNSWTHFYTVKPKPGFVVEGMYWSNGMMYQVRDNVNNDFTIHEMTLSIDLLTKTTYNFPDVE